MQGCCAKTSFSSSNQAPPKLRVSYLLEINNTTIHAEPYHLRSNLTSNMSMHSVANLPRLSSTDLSKIILSQASSNVDAETPPSDIAIIDVRDDGPSNPQCNYSVLTVIDHIGGHIKHSIHAPSTTLDTKIPELVRKLKNKETVVFHCALSQQRGPSAALRYIRERDRLLGLSANLQSGSGVGQVLKKNNAEEVKQGDTDGAWEDVEDETKEPKEQKVYVLDRGFVGWQEVYGEDPRLTEGYRKEIWKEGYWM